MSVTHNEAGSGKAYPADDGPLTDQQIAAIKAAAPEVKSGAVLSTIIRTDGQGASIQDLSDLGPKVANSLEVHPPGFRSVDENNLITSRQRQTE